ncbi:MAG: 50S ribosomal protein L32 [bacterium]
MANPKRKHSRSRRDMRRAHWKVTVVNYNECPQCHEVKLPHKICPFCGFYNGVLVLPKKVKKKKQEQQTQGAK